MEVRSNDWLLNFRSNTSSQFGEDGIIEQVLGLLGETDNWCVEFGAWDGVFCSNTHHLIKNKGYQGVLIEADAAKMSDLKETYSDRADLYLLNRFVSCTAAKDKLDSILAETPIPDNFDLLSIDIDSDDYHVWASLMHYRPKVVVIEFNNTIPSHIDVVQPVGSGNNLGASLLSLCHLAREKGYELVCATDNNGIFVDQKYFEAFDISDNHPSVMWRHFEHRYLTYIYQGYDSTLHIVGNNKMFWSLRPLIISEKHLQLLPGPLRFFPASVSRLRRALSVLFIKLFKRDLIYSSDKDPFVSYMNRQWANKYDDL